MVSSNEHLVDQLRLGNQETSKDSSPIFEELQRVLTPDDVAAGVGLRFGADREALKATIECLGLDQMVADSAPMRIIQIIVEESGSTAFLGKSIDMVSQLPLADALDVMQIERWDIQDGYGSLKDVKMPKRPVATSILLAKASKSQDGILVDTTHPGILLTAEYSSSAELEDEDAILSPSLSEYIENQTDKEAIVGAFATYVAAYDLKLRMPYSAYTLDIGPLTQGKSILGGAGGVKIIKDYVLEYGRFNQLS